jgi:hypothetical protein
LEEDEDTCFIWAAAYHNISTILGEVVIEFYRAWQNWTDENRRNFLCELEEGVVRTFGFVMLVKKGNPFFEFTDHVICHIVEGGIFMSIKRGVSINSGVKV